MKTNLSHAGSVNILGVLPHASLFSAAAIRWVSMGVSVLLGLLVTPIIVARLGKESYGLWGLAASFLGFYGVFDLGLASATKGLELLHCRRRLPQMKVRFMDFDVAIARKLLGFGAAAYLVILAEIVRSKLDIMIVTRVGGYFLDFATNPGIGSLYATAHHRYFAGQTMAEALASFTLAFLLGREYGMVGVAVGIVIPILVVKLTIQPWYVTRILSIPLRGYWLRSIGMPALCAIWLLVLEKGDRLYLGSHLGWILARCAIPRRVRSSRSVLPWEK